MHVANHFQALVVVVLRLLRYLTYRTLSDMPCLLSVCTRQSPSVSFSALTRASLLYGRSNREQTWREMGPGYRLNVLPHRRLRILLQQQIWKSMGELESVLETCSFQPPDNESVMAVPHSQRRY